MDYLHYQTDDLSVYRCDQTIPFSSFGAQSPFCMSQTFDNDTLGLGDDLMDEDFDIFDHGHASHTSFGHLEWPHFLTTEPFVEYDYEAEDCLKNPVERGISNASARENPKSQKDRGRRRRLTKDQVAVLNVWLSAHASCPYPTETEKLELAAATKLSKKQVEHWFSRTRQRKLPVPEIKLHSKQYSVTTSDQPSLEVLPPHSTPSEPKSPRSTSSNSSHGSLEAPTLPIQQLGSFERPMLSWWFENLATQACYSLQQEQITWHIPSSTRMDKRLKRIATSLHDKCGLVLYDTLKPIDRAFLRLTKLLEITMTKHCEDLRYLSTAFFLLERPQASILDNTLNEIDDIPTIPLALGSMVYQIQAWLDSPAVCDFTSFHPIFAIAIKRLWSELTLVHTNSKRGSSSPTADDQYRAEKATDSLLSWVKKTTRHEGFEKNMVNGYAAKDSGSWADDSPSAGSGSTGGSSRSAYSSTSRGSRRGRRRPTAQPYPSFYSPGEDLEHNWYQCTFCPKSFGLKFT